MDHLNEPLNTELNLFLRELAAASGELIKGHYFRPDLHVDIKSDLSPVTQADTGAERLMRDMIAQKYPQHGVLGEEFENTNTDAEFVWVLDPIDGTVSFTTGCPLFGTLIGLLYQGEPYLGCIHQPIVGQLCTGDNQSAHMNGTPIRVREPRTLDAATLLTTDIKLVDRFANRRGFDALVAATKTFRTWGDCYGYLLLSSGFADIMVDPMLKAFDVLPLIPVVRGAGAMITDWAGEPAGADRSCVASHPALHAQVLALLGS